MLSLEGLEAEVKTPTESPYPVIRAYVNALREVNGPTYKLLEISIIGGDLPEHIAGALRPYASWIEVPIPKV